MPRRTKPRNQKKTAEVVVHQADSAVAEEQPPPFPQPEVAAVQNQEEKKEEEKNADHSSPGFTPPFLKPTYSPMPQLSLQCSPTHLWKFLKLALQHNSKLSIL